MFENAEDGAKKFKLKIMKSSLKSMISIRGSMQTGQGNVNTTIPTGERFESMMPSLKIPYEDDTSSDDDEDDNNDEGESKQLMESILSKLAQQKENAKLRKRKTRDDLVTENVDNFITNANRFVHPVKLKLDEAKKNCDALKYTLKDMKGMLKRIEKLNSDIITIKEIHEGRLTLLSQQLSELEQQSLQFPQIMKQRTEEEVIRMRDQLHQQMEILSDKLKKINDKDDGLMKLLRVVVSTMAED